MSHLLATSGFTNQKYPNVKMTVHMDESIINNIIIKLQKSKSQKSLGKKIKKINISEYKL